MPTSSPRTTIILTLCLALFACSKDGGDAGSAGSATSSPAAAPSADTPGNVATAAANGRTDLPPLCKGCNVILISLDTVRADHLGCYGYGRDTSPNVDALARRSVVFEHAVSQAAWTLPAHGAMMTGLYPSRLGVTHYPALRRLPVGVDMLAEQFKRAGYVTAGFTGGGFVAASFGFDRGFDIYTTGGRRFEHNLDEVLPWLDQNADRRFFLFLHGYNAHRPYYSDAEDKAAMGLPKRAPIERKGFCTREKRQKPPAKQLEAIVRYYDAAIHDGDRQVGRFLDAVAEHGLYDHTVILVTADHGEEFFEHGNCDHVRFLYREVVGVPYILFVPRLSPNGRHVKELVPASISVPRTLLDVVGIDNQMPGVSLAPILSGETRLFDTVYSEASSVAGKLGSRGPTIAVTTNREKLISYTQEGTDEAYDIVADPWEQHVLPVSHEAYAMRSTLYAWKSALVALPRVLPGAQELAHTRSRAADTAAAAARRIDGRRAGQPPNGLIDHAGAPRAAHAAIPVPAGKAAPNEAAGAAAGGTGRHEAVPPAAQSATAAHEADSSAGAETAHARVSKQEPAGAGVDAGGEKPEEIPEDVRKQLESLGYVDQ